MQPVELEDDGIGLGVLPLFLVQGLDQPHFPTRSEVGREVAAVLRNIFMPPAMKMEEVMKLLEDGTEWSETSTKPPAIWPEFVEDQPQAVVGELSYILKLIIA